MDSGGPSTYWLHIGEEISIYSESHQHTGKGSTPVGEITNDRSMDQTAGKHLKLSTIPQNYTTTILIYWECTYGPT